MKLDDLVCEIVRRPDGRTSRVVVVNLPCGDRPVLVRGAAYVDDAGSSEIRPREFLFAIPDYFDGFAGGLCEPRGFDRALAGVFAAIARAGVGHKNPDALFGDSKRLG